MTEITDWNEEELHSVASCTVGLTDFGDNWYLPGLRDEIEKFAKLELTDSGRRWFFRRIVDTLIARLYSEKGWASNPQVLSLSIRRPVVIIGLPRTGTTALHRLLASDSQFQGLQYWLARRPMIRPPRDTWAQLPEYRACENYIRTTFTSEFQKMHAVRADELEECDDIIYQGFPTNPECVLRAYSRYANVLRLIGGHDHDKTWLLKAPCHMINIEALLGVFPDAYIIHIHRDPLESLNSWCNLVYLQRQMLEGESLPLGTIGPAECSYWRKAIDQVQSCRANSEWHFFDLDQRQLLTQPLEAVRSVYRYCGLELSELTERKMRALIASWSGPIPSSRKRATAEFGISENYIRDMFSGYRKDHGYD